MAILGVELYSWNSFKINFTEEIKVDDIHFFIDDIEHSFKIVRSSNNYLIAEFKGDISIIGNALYIKVNNSPYYIDKTPASNFADFEDFYYTDEPLGALYSHKSTTFKLWAPLCEKVFLLLDKKRIPMVRSTRGVFSINVDRHLDGYSYSYEIHINNTKDVVVDPYSFSTLANGKKSSVINLKRLDKIDTLDNHLPPFNNYLEAIIYETSVRDMTSEKSTNIKHKGKYLGLIEKNRHTSHNHPAGFDYITSLGITHLQLMPVLDFATIDETDSEHSYNWGYDPMHYFALEGSYSTKPNNAYMRMIEFKRLVRLYHQRGIRINLDVVYNHVYSVETSTLQRIVPNYYFRIDKQGNFENHSYCGNDLASEKKMVRRLIIDSALFLVNTYHIDGFRFDLMGLLDVVTMNELSFKIKNIKPDFMFYGEGWDMCANTKGNIPLANMNNAKLLPDFAFFNDRFRTIVKGVGGNAKLDDVGYMLGNTVYKDGFKFAFLGSSYDITFPSLFKHSCQSINYVECHDNATIRDSIATSIHTNDVNFIVENINKLLLFSVGIPFLHAGQEIAQGKNGHHNTYNEGDALNQFSYRLLDQNYEMVSSLKHFIALRKRLSFFKKNDMNEIAKSVQFHNYNDVLEVKFVDNNSNYYLYINPTTNTAKLNIDRNLQIFGDKKNSARKEATSFDILPKQVLLLYESDNF